MDIHAVIKTDHDEARELMEKIVRARADHRREEMALELKEMILLHAKSEEATYYNALIEKGMEQKMSHAKEEHETVEKLFAELESINPASDRWLIVFGEIKQGLEHHMEEEEGDIFKKSQELISAEEGEQLGAEMLELKEEIQVEFEAA